MEEGTFGVPSSMPNLTPSVQRVAPAGRKTSKSVSESIKYRQFVLWAILLVKTEMLRRNGPVIKPWSLSWGRKGVYGGKDLWKSEVLSREWKREGVMDGESGELTGNWAWTGKSETERLEWCWWRELGNWFQRQGEAYRKEWSVIRNEDDVGGRVRVTRDEEWVLRGQGCWTEMRLCKYGGWEDFVNEWEEFIFDAFGYFGPVKRA